MNPKTIISKKALCNCGGNYTITFTDRKGGKDRISRAAKDMHLTCGCGRGYTFSNAYPISCSVGFDDLSDDVCVEEISLQYEAGQAVPLYNMGPHKFMVGRGFETITLEGLRGPTADVLREWYDDIMKGMFMCSHDEFVILLYVHGFMIRQCKKCKEVEMKIEDWLPTEHLSKIFGFEFLEAVAENFPEVAKALAVPKR
jgi:hypothetical protein